MRKTLAAALLFSCITPVAFAQEARGPSPVAEGVTVDDSREIPVEASVEAAPSTADGASERPAHDVTIDPLVSLGRVGEDALGEDARRAALQRTLQKKSRRQLSGTAGTLFTSAALSLPIGLVASREGCELNKSICSSYSAGNFGSVGDDFALAAPLTALTTSVVGTGMLFAIGGNNRRLSQMDADFETLQQARAQMLVRYGRRTQWAGAGVAIGGATAAAVGGVLYAATASNCEVGDCATTPGATKAVVVGSLVGVVTGGMMLGVGTRTRKRGQDALLDDESPFALSFSPWIDPRGGSGGTMVMTW